jgi:uncharacterized phiE125 gp8 family phage protein
VEQPTLSFRTALVTAPTEEPLTLAEAKLHLRIATTNTREDTIVTRLIVAARQRCESELGRALVTQTHDLFLDAWPADGEIRVPMPPLASVTHVKYYDSTETLATLDAGDYTVHTGTPGRIALAYESTWPSLYLRPDAIQVRFVAGYGAASTVPDAIKAAMLLIIGDLYKFRESGVVGTTIANISFGAAALLDAERWGGYQ